LKFSQKNSQEEGTFDCGLCGQSVAIDVRAVGTGVNCPHCDGEIVVPGFVKAHHAESETTDKSIPCQSAADDPSAKEKAIDIALPPPRKSGKLPKVSAIADDSKALPPYRFTGAAPSLVDSAAIVSAISRGEVDILKSREMGNHHIVFGCPFCAKPIEIKRRQQGKRLKCGECSGMMIAPDHAAGVEVKPVSGQGGIAGGREVQLPGVKARSLQKAGSRKVAAESSVAQREKQHDNSPEEIIPETGVAEEKTVRHRLNNDRDRKLIPRDLAESGGDIRDAWKTYPETERRTVGWLRKLRFFSLIIMITSMAVVVAVLIKRANTLKREAELKGNFQGKESVTRTTVQKVIHLSSEFSILSTVNKRLKYVRHPDVSAVRMKYFYAGLVNNSVFPPLDVRSYQETMIKGIKFARMTSVIESGKRQREFFFELNDDGSILLDWESAVGYCDVDVMEYRRDLSPGAVQMRVMVKPSNYYGFEFTDTDTYACYEITDLNSRIRIYGYAMRESVTGDALLGLHLGDQGEEAGFVYCTLMLRANRVADRDNARQVWIEGMVAPTWLLP
jgi:transcription elongation factor Elf1